MSIKQLTDEQIKAIMTKTKAIPTKSEVVRNLLRQPAAKPQPPRSPNAGK
jgi:hypothetical protein